LPKYSKILKFFLLFSLTYSQIWLIPLVDDHQHGYIAKLKKIKNKKKSLVIVYCETYQPALSQEEILVTSNMTRNILG